MTAAFVWVPWTLFFYVCSTSNIVLISQVIWIIIKRHVGATISLTRFFIGVRLRIISIMTMMRVWIYVRRHMSFFITVMRIGLDMFWTTTTSSSMFSWAFVPGSNIHIIWNICSTCQVGINTGCSSCFAASFVKFTLALLSLLPFLMLVVSFVSCALTVSTFIWLSQACSSGLSKLEISMASFSPNYVIFIIFHNVS